MRQFLLPEGPSTSPLLGPMIKRSPSSHCPFRPFMTLFWLRTCCIEWVTRPASAGSQLWFTHGLGEHPQAPGETQRFPSPALSRNKYRYFMHIFR